MARKQKKPVELSASAVDNADRLRSLIKRCDSGDEGARGDLRAALDDSKTLARLSDLSDNTERVWLDKTLGDVEGTKEFCKAHLAQMRRTLCGPDPTPLEQLLVKRISLCWLQVQYADAIYAENMASCSLDLGEYMQRRQERAHRRLLSAVKALAQVRRLSVPLIQLNVADKQINLLSGHSSGGDATDVEDS